jgi:uncharacterized protein YbaR (Trm112 family)
MASFFQIVPSSPYYSSFGKMTMQSTNLGSFRKMSVLSSKPHPARSTLVKLRLSMAISKELLEILVCPVCKAELILKEDGSGLKCVECKRVYPVRDDIPIMLVDQATIEP